MSTWSDRSPESGAVGQCNLAVVTGDVVLWHGTLTAASNWLQVSSKEVVAWRSLALQSRQSPAQDLKSFGLILHQWRLPLTESCSISLDGPGIFSQKPAHHNYVRPHGMQCSSILMTWSTHLSCVFSSMDLILEEWAQSKTSVADAFLPGYSKYEANRMHVELLHLFFLDSKGTNRTNTWPVIYYSKSHFCGPHSHFQQVLTVLAQHKNNKEQRQELFH